MPDLRRRLPKCTDDDKTLFNDCMLGSNDPEEERLKICCQTITCANPELVDNRCLPLDDGIPKIPKFNYIENYKKKFSGIGIF